MLLRTWFASRLGQGGRRHIVVMLALALTANVWSLSPVAGSGIFSTSALDLAADTAAILGVAETAETAKGQSDHFDGVAFTVAYPDAPEPVGSLRRGAHPQVATSREWGGFPHKTGPPARS